MRQLSPQFLLHFMHLDALSLRDTFGCTDVWHRAQHPYGPCLISSARCVTPQNQLSCARMTGLQQAYPMYRGKAEPWRLQSCGGCRCLGFHRAAQGMMRCQASSARRLLTRSACPSCVAGVGPGRRAQPGCWSPGWWSGCRGPAHTPPPPYSARTTDRTSLRSSSGCCPLLPDSWAEASRALSPVHVMALCHCANISWEEMLVWLFPGCMPPRHQQPQQ